MRTLDGVINELLEYRKLQPNWDGENGIPPTVAGIMLACEFVRTVPEEFELPMPMISSTGKLGLYWYRPACYIDVELEPDDRFSLLVTKPGARNRDVWFDSLPIERFTVTFYREHFWPFERVRRKA